MRKALLATIALALVGATFYLGAQPGTDTVKVRLKLIDASTGNSIVGIVRVLDEAGKHIVLPGLYDRMTALTKDNPGVHWYIIPAGGARCDTWRAR